MSFDEKKFLDNLAGVDTSIHKIKQISNYMIYHRELNHEKIVDTWKRQFFSVSADNKIILIYVANEVIMQTSRKGKLEYVRDFGDSFIECFKDVIRKTENTDILNTLIKLCDMWENELLYANNFMELLRKWVRSRIAELQNSTEDTAGIERLNSLQNDLKFINKWEYCTQNFTLDIQEENIKTIYETIDKDKVNSLTANYNPDTNNFKNIKEYEEKLKGLRSLLITDISKREKFILSLSDFIANEKDNYFSYENSPNY